VHGLADPAERIRPSGSGLADPAERTRPSGPGRADPAERTRPSGSGRADPAERTRPGGSGRQEESGLLYAASKRFGGLQIAVKRLQKPRGQRVKARVAEMNTRNARVHLYARVHIFARSVYFGVAPVRVVRHARTSFNTIYTKRHFCE